MSADLDLILGKIDNLSHEDLIKLRSDIDMKLQSPTTNGNANGKNNKASSAPAANALPENWQNSVPDAFSLEAQAKIEENTVEFYEAIFTHDELAEMLGVSSKQFDRLTYSMVQKIIAETDMSNLSDISLSDAVNSDREDRF